MGMVLFDDADNEVENISEIAVDQEFAKRFQHNKEREELQRLEEKKKKGLIESDDDDEDDDDDDDDDVVAGKKKIEFLDALLKIRKKDPVLLQKDVKLFESSDEDRSDGEGDGDGGERKNKPKPKYLKDVMVEVPVSEDEDDDDGDDQKKVKSFVQEQEDLRSEVLAGLAAEESDEDGELLREKKEGCNDEESEGVDEEEKSKLDEFFGDDNELAEDDKFLKEFIGKELWSKKKHGNGKDSVVDEGGEMIGFSDDEEAVEMQEDYERGFNFRFEEGKSDRIVGHSRIIEGSVRKGTDTRRLARERKKERIEIAEMERREEVKRLKNLKRKEVLEKLRKIKEVAGVEGEGIELDEEDLEGDFDPEKFDKTMKKAFGAEYYGAEDVDPEFGNESDGEGDLEKPDFDKEDELLGLPKNWDVIKSKEGFMAKRAERKKSEVEGEQMQGEEDEGGDEEQKGEEDEGDVGDELRVEGKRKRKQKSKLRELLKKDLEEELYKLDYEDAIGDLKTRFKYRSVKQDRFKLSAAEILWLDEQELNQYVSLKKLAPYRDQEWKVPQMRKQLLLGGLLNGQKSQKKRRIDEKGSGGSTSKKSFKDGAKSQEESNEESKLSRSARRRRNQKEKKLPASRLLAYGKTFSSTKNKSRF